MRALNFIAIDRFNPILFPTCASIMEPRAAPDRTSKIDFNNKRLILLFEAHWMLLKHRSRDGGRHGRAMCWMTGSLVPLQSWGGSGVASSLVPL